MTIQGDNVNTTDPEFRTAVAAPVDPALAILTARIEALERAAAKTHNRDRFAELEARDEASQQCLAQRHMDRKL